MATIAVIDSLFFIVVLYLVCNRDISSSRPCIIAKKCIGEAHQEHAGKKIIIENLDELKKHGVTIIFLEHVMSDTQKELLDIYLIPET